MITDHELKSVELRLRWIRPERSPMQSKQSNLSEKVQSPKWEGFVQPSRLARVLSGTPAPKNNVPAYFNASAAAATAAAVSTPSAPSTAAVVRRGNRRFPQLLLLPLSESSEIHSEFASALGGYYEVVSRHCLRNLFLRFGSPEQKSKNRCYPNQCECAHPPEKICTQFRDFIITECADGVNILRAMKSCARNNCKFWPCSELPAKISQDKKSFFSWVNSREESHRAAEAAKSISNVVADPSEIVRLPQKKQECFISAEKLAMRVSDPELHSVWSLPCYASLPESEFRERLHVDYLAWNCIGISSVRGAKLDEDDDEWAQDDAEVFDADHRLEFADFIASLRGVSLSEDRRVIGSQAAMLVAETNGDVFGEYVRACWKFDGRPMRMRRGDVQTFNEWLNSHSNYSTIYQLIKSGESWSGAKKALRGVRTMPIVAEACDWESMTLCHGAAADVCGLDSALSTQMLESMCQEAMPVSSVRSALQEIVADGKVKSWKKARTILKERAREEARNGHPAPIAREIRNAGRQEAEIPIVSGPSYLEEQSPCMFVERNVQGFFAIHLKLAVIEPSQEVLRAISDLWSRFRVGPGRASFVAASDSLFLKIEGSIKDAQGFHQMFEKFPSFIAALRREQYLIGENLYAIPVERLSDDAEDVELGTMMLLTGVEEVVEEVESDNVKNCGFLFASSPKRVVSASTNAVKYKGRIDVYELCDIIVMYMKK